MKIAAMLIGLLLVVGTGSAQQTTLRKTRPSCDAVREVLKLMDTLDAGDTREKVEKTFELDGGMQSPAHSTYLLKDCRYIKIEVEFSGEGIEHRIDFLPADRIVRISKPFIEYPAAD